MKNGKKPTREQRKLIEKAGLLSSDWLVSKDLPSEIELVHRYFDKVKKCIRKSNFDA